MTKEELMKFICTMFNITKCPDLILKQIYKNVTERRYSYLDIARALSFFVDVQGNTLELKYGIGIVPYIMDEARAYFKEQERIRDEQRAAAEATKAKGKGQNTVVVRRQKKQQQIMRPHINIDIL